MIVTPEIDNIEAAKWKLYLTDFDGEMSLILNNDLSYEIDELIENEIWLTADRRKIPVKEMSTNHIQNCIRCWNGEGGMRIPENYLGGKEKWLKIFNDELIARS